VASPALRTRSARGAYRPRGASTGTDGFPDGSVADGVAVANKHGSTELKERSKMIMTFNIAPGASRAAVGERL
jgi:hypothetical protein